jgi:hypothetical protein
MKTLIDPRSVDFGSMVLAVVATVVIAVIALMDAYAQLKGLPRITVDPTIFAFAAGIVAHYFGRATKGLSIPTASTQSTTTTSTTIPVDAITGNVAPLSTATEEVPTEPVVETPAVEVTPVPDTSADQFDAA